MASTARSSKRVAKFQREMIATLPRFPNDKASLQLVEAMSLTDLLVAFLSWRLRFVAMRPRKFIAHSSATSDPRWSTLSANIAAFRAAVVAGQDLTPYLSLEPRTRGFSPAARGLNADTWVDKDFLLNVMGFHHFHLGLTMEAAGHIARTNEVIFAAVDRDCFHAIGVFDHSAFENEDPNAMTPERQRLWQTHENWIAAGVSPGAFIVSGGFGGLGISTSAHPTAVVMAAMDYVRIINSIDPQLDDPAYVEQTFGALAAGQKRKLEWSLMYMDLGLFDPPSNTFYSLRRGPN